MSKYNWTRQETKDLITLYEINECLWNKNLREYKDRDERISSIQSISDEMKISIEEINKKIHNLRNQYRFELNKTKKKIVGKPRWVESLVIIWRALWWFFDSFTKIHNQMALLSKPKLFGEYCFGSGLELTSKQHRWLHGNERIHSGKSEFLYFW